MRIGLSPRPKNHLINKNISPHCVILNFSLDKIKTFFYSALSLYIFERPQQEEEQF